MASAAPNGQASQHHRPALFPPIAMRVSEACRYIGISRSTLYVLIAQGEIEIVKLGCSTLVLTESLKGLVIRRRRSVGDKAAGIER